MKEKSESEVAQSCLTLSDSMICSLSGSSIHGIFQARVLEWGATSFDFSLLLLVQDWVTPRNSYYTLSLIAVKVLSWLSQETVFKVAKFKSTNCWRQLYRDFSSMKVREVGLGRERNWTVMTLQQWPSFQLIETSCWWALQNSPILDKVQDFESYIHSSVDEGYPTEGM